MNQQLRFELAPLVPTVGAAITQPCPKTWGQGDNYLIWCVLYIRSAAQRNTCAQAHARPRAHAIRTGTLLRPHHESSTCKHRYQTKAGAKTPITSTLTRLHPWSATRTRAHTHTIHPHAHPTHSSTHPPHTHTQTLGGKTKAEKSTM